MTEFLINAKDSLVYWKMAVVHALLFSAMSGGGAWIAATSSITAQQWSGMGGWDRSKLYVGVGMTVCGSIMAFLNKTMSELRNAQAESVPTLDIPK